MSFLPELEREYLLEKGIAFREVASGGQNGLILPNWPLPVGRYTRTHSDLLVLLPSGFPDVPPDMWYFEPAVLLAPHGQEARQTQYSIPFETRTWQRWSRHFPPSEWRMGKDGIHTFLKRVEHALSIAS